MKRAAVAILLFATLLFAAQDKKRKQPKPPDLQIVNVTVHRSDEGISIDGKAKNTGERTLQRVLLLIDFLSMDKAVLTTKNGPLEVETLEPGKESDFRLQISDQGRAVRIRFNAEDADKRDLRIANAGPFLIE